MTTLSYTCTTAYGALADDLGAIRHNHPRLDMRVDLHHLPSTAYRRQQRRVDIHIDHNRLLHVGRLEHLELDDAGKLMAVASLHDDDPDLRTGKWWWSVSCEYRTADHFDGDDIELLELSMTRTPASIGLPPIQFVRGALTEANELSLVPVLQRARQQMRQYRTDDSLSIHRPATIASVEHLTNGTLVVNGEALATARSNHRSSVEVPVDEPVNCWAIAAESLIFVRLAGSGSARRLHFGKDVIGTRSPTDDLDLDGPLHAFRTVTTERGREVLQLVADQVLDTARLRRFVDGRVSVELY